MTARDFWRSLSEGEHDFIYSEGFDWMDWLTRPPTKEFRANLGREIWLWVRGYRP